LPAVTEEDMPPRPVPDRVAVHAPDPLAAPPVTTVVLPLELPTLTELLTCASELDAARHNSARAIAGIFKVCSFIRGKRIGEPVRHADPRPFIDRQR